MAHYTTSSSTSSSSISHPRSPSGTPIDSPHAMTRSPSSEPSKHAKRKGTRSVSTLTPSQLARKRANDREAQRAIRARTKEHIERLEREVEELKSQRNRDEALQDLIRKNKALEKEMHRMRESFGMPTSHPYPSVSSKASSSFGQNSPDYHHQVGDPASTGSTEEYGYISTSVPSGIECLPPSLRSAPLKYEELESSADHAYATKTTPVQLPPSYMHHQQWQVYNPSYYPQSPAL